MLFNIVAVALDPSRCPSDLDEVAEGYVMGTLHGADATAFEEHFLTCGKCRGAVESADEYVRAMRTAVVRLRVRAAGR